VIQSGKNTKTLTNRYEIKLDNSTPTIFPTQYFPMAQIVKSSSGDTYIKTRKKTNESINCLKSNTGSLIFDLQQKSDILNTQFQSIFTTEDLTNMPNKGTTPYPEINDIESSFQTAIHTNHLVLTISIQVF